MEAHISAPNEATFPKLWSELPGISRSLHKRVADLLRRAIVTGELAPGSRLIEQDISGQLGVSRGPVREAIRELEQEGLVRSFPNRGAEVLGISEAEVHELLIPIRVVIEGFAYVSAQKLITDEDVAALEQLIEEMRSDDLHRVVEADVRFHELILERSGQPHALQIWRTIAPRIRAYFYLHGIYSDNTSKFADEHAELLHTFRFGTKRELQRALKTHIEVGWLDVD